MAEGSRNIQNPEVDLLVTTRQVVTLGRDSGPRFGADMKEIGVLAPGALAIDAGKIVAVGAPREIIQKYRARKRLDLDSCITPGLVDPHTHLVFAGSREKDFYERLRGVSYEEIAKRGGGILESVRHLRAATPDDLLEISLERLKQFLRHGTTTCEIKSGYGLNLEDEVKTLEVIKKLSKIQPVSLVATFLGAHEVPEEFRKDRGKYIQLLCEKILPEIKKKDLARFCDIFCEKNVFDIDETGKILSRARELGFELKLHADELAENFGGAELAVELKAASADHLVQISKKGMQTLAKSETLAVLLPATTFFLGKSKFAPARSMIDGGCAVALGTDLNPGSSNTESLQVVMTLAAVNLKMTPEEILTAVTHNAACAIGENARVGRLMPGLNADFVVWDLADYQHIPYHFGGNRVQMVFKSGRLAWDALS